MTGTPWQVAEKIAESHLNDLGFFRVRRTSSGADGGLDVIGQGIAAQVKLLRTPVGSPDIQRLRGAAHRVDNAVFYAHEASAYSRSALNIADKTEVALFTYSLDGRVRSVNRHAAELESPLRAVQRSLMQQQVASARLKAVKLLTEAEIDGISTRLHEIAGQLEAIIAALPAGATVEDLPADVVALKEEGQALAARFHGRLPLEQMDAAKSAAVRVAEIMGAVEHQGLDDLLETPWREELAEGVSGFHAMVDLFTTATILWLGTDLVRRLHELVRSIAGADESPITPEDALEGWPKLPLG